MPSGIGYVFGSEVGIAHKVCFLTAGHGASGWSEKSKFKFGFVAHHVTCPFRLEDNIYVR